MLANDTDVDNVAPTAANAGLTVVAVGAASHGTVSFTATGVTYTPTGNYYGLDSFTYTISDNGTIAAGHNSQATVNVTVTNVNDAPVAVNDTATVDEDSTVNVINVLANDTDVDNLAPAAANAGLTVVAAGAASHGTVSFTATGVTYSPAPNYYGPDSFTYTISDNGTIAVGHNSQATVNVTVTNVNDAPVAVNDTAMVNEDSTANVINVLANDTDPDNLTGPANAGLTVVAVGTASHGQVSLIGGAVTYTPAANYDGPDSFTYTISDGSSSDTATVTIMVKLVKASPTVGSAMSWMLHDSLTINGVRPGGTYPSSDGQAIVTFKLYGPDDVGCQGLPINGTDGESVSIAFGQPGASGLATGTAKTTIGYLLGENVLNDREGKKATYRWTTKYSGDTQNNGGETQCGSESHTITVISPESNIQNP